MKILVEKLENLEAWGSFMCRLFVKHLATNHKYYNILSICVAYYALEQGYSAHYI